MTDRLRFTAALLTNPLDQSPRWSAGGNNAHELVAKAFTRQRGDEIVVLTDHETGARVRVGADDEQVVL